MRAALQACGVQGNTGVRCDAARRSREPGGGCPGTERFLFCAVCNYLVVLFRAVCNYLGQVWQLGYGFSGARTKPTDQEQNGATLLFLVFPITERRFKGCSYCGYKPSLSLY